MHGRRCITLGCFAVGSKYGCRVEVSFSHCYGQTYYHLRKLSCHGCSLPFVIDCNVINSSITSHANDVPLSLSLTSLAMLQVAAGLN